MLITIIFVALIISIASLIGCIALLFRVERLEDFRREHRTSHWIEGG